VSDIGRDVFAKDPGKERAFSINFSQLDHASTHTFDSTSTHTLEHDLTHTLDLVSPQRVGVRTLVFWINIINNLDFCPFCYWVPSFSIFVFF